MVDEREKTSEQGEKKSPRTVQVLATALAAVTAALLGSTLGVTGTVVGAGVASVITTVGGELYLRSLQRGREAALKARQALVTAGQRRASRPGFAPVDDPAQMPTVLLPLDPSEMPTVRISKLSPTAAAQTQAQTQPEEPESFADKLRKLRWPLIAGTSVLATAIAIAVMVGVEAVSHGQAGAGFIYHNNKPTTTQQEPTKDDNPPATSENSPPPSTGVSQAPPPSSSSSSTSTSETPTSQTSISETPPPSSTGGAPSTTQSQPRTKAASATPTP
ncbi:hypothetical protein [Amycolatopsis sp. NPDC051903]|uniref:hypothetical protein n=1 Tax=Amycolatopsis sp. NPDC051903 TaxID=3363936 RepID=UPI0037B41D18